MLCDDDDKICLLEMAPTNSGCLYVAVSVHGMYESLKVHELQGKHCTLRV